MSFTVLGMGKALPEFSIGVDEIAKYVAENFCETDRQRRVTPGLYKMSGVKKRHSVLLTSAEAKEGETRYTLLRTPESAEDKGPTVGERMLKYEEKAYPLACEASQEALKNSGVAASDITHLVTVSCSGFYAPGVDVRLIKDLGLPRTVERAHVGFMGCHGALNGLRVSRGFAESDPGAHVLLCAVELCSIHFHYGWNPEQVVANALFADGAAAMVGADRSGSKGWRTQATGACLIPDSEDAMTWRIGDNGFAMTLSAQVPGLIAEHLRPWLEEWLAPEGLAVDDIKTWAIHPGGPRILTSAGKALGLEKEDLSVSREILSEFGNMSSPTILFIIDRLQTRGAETPCVALAFGPGLMAEAALFI